MTIWHRRRRQGTKASWMERRGECAIALTCKWSFVTELKFPDPLYPLPKGDFFLPIVWRKKARIQVCVWQEELQTKWLISLKDSVFKFTIVSSINEIMILSLLLIRFPHNKACMQIWHDTKRSLIVFWVVFCLNSLRVSVRLCLLSVVIIETECALKEGFAVCVGVLMAGHLCHPTAPPTLQLRRQRRTCLKGACSGGGGVLFVTPCYVVLFVPLCLSVIQHSQSFYQILKKKNI